MEGPPPISDSYAAAEDIPFRDGPPAYLDEADAALYASADPIDMAEWRSRAASTSGRKPAGPAIKATPFGWPDPSTIPLRPWVYGRWLLRNTVTAVVAPGGVGKSSFMASTILALASGRDLLGKTIWDGPQHVWYWNLEDDGEELARQIQSAAKHHRVSAADCGERLFVDSGLDGAGLCTAVETANGFEIVRPVIEALVEELLVREMDVLIVDPFVSSHQVSENDNGAIDAVAKEWARVAKRANCSIVLVHHTKKLGGMKVTAEMSRGAVSLIAAARSTLVLNRMEPEEATRFGIEGDDERRRYFNVQDDKANRAPAEKADWYRIASVDLGNGEGDAPGDNVGVVTCWSPPDMFEGVTADHLLQVQRLIDVGNYRESSQANDWVGKAVATVLGLSADKEAKGDRAKINALIRQWLASGALARETKYDPARREDKPFIVVGVWAEQDIAPPTPFRGRVVGQAGQTGIQVGQGAADPASIHRHHDGEDEGLGPDAGQIDR